MAAIRDPLPSMASLQQLERAENTTVTGVIRDDFNPGDFWKYRDLSEVGKPIPITVFSYRWDASMPCADDGYNSLAISTGDRSKKLKKEDGKGKRRAADRNGCDWEN